MKDDTGGIREERRSVPLETHDKELARRKMKKVVAMLASGELVADAAEAEADAAKAKAEAEAEAEAAEAKEETFEVYAPAQIERRRTEVRSAGNDLGFLERHVFPHVGPMTLKEIKPVNVRSVLHASIEHGHRRRTVVKVRAVLVRVMRRAWKTSSSSRTPSPVCACPRWLRRICLPREILTDEEFSTFMGSPSADVELKILSLTARAEGGMHTGDLTHCTWAALDLERFETCTIPRMKKGKPQALEIAVVLRPFLRVWWGRQGSPATGPVFPVRRSPHVGQGRLRRTCHRSRDARCPLSAGRDGGDRRTRCRAVVPIPAAAMPLLGPPSLSPAVSSGDERSRLE